MEQNKKLWFRRKRYGWGWFPITWEGWFTILIYVLAMGMIASSIDERQHSVSDFLINFSLPYIGVTLILIYVCYKKGEKPKWTWGDDK